MDPLQDSLQYSLGFASHFQEIGGFNCHYLDEGRGKPVLLLHGNPTWSFMYRRVIQGLKGSCRLIAPDHIGCGLSDKPGNSDYEFCMERRVSDLEVFVNSLGLTEPLTLVVHDWGGLIGLAWAVRNRKRVARLVVLNTAAFLVPEGTRLHWSIRLCRTSRLAAFLILRGNLFARAAARLGTVGGLSAEVRDGFLSPYGSPRERIAILRFIQDIPLSERDPSYGTVLKTQQALEQLQKLPMLICWGERDFVFDGAFLNEWRRRFPEAIVRTYSQAGHYVLEDAWEEIIPEMKAFILEDALP